MPIADAALADVLRRRGKRVWVMVIVATLVASAVLLAAPRFLSEPA